MEKYMYLFRGGDMSGLSPQEQEAHMARWFAWVKKLQNENRYIAGEPLLPKAKTISGSKRAVTDGPYTESKEVIGGFFIIHARSFDEAVELTRDFPDYELEGSIEVREVMKLDNP